MALHGRTEWGARPPAYPVSPAPNELYSIMHHSAGPNKAWTFNEMCAHVRGIQDYHINAMDGADIYYGELIFPDGTSFEGRYGGLWVNNGGAYGSCHIGWGYCLVGNYNKVTPTDVMLAYARERVLQVHRQLSIMWDKAMGHRDMWFIDMRNWGNDCPGHFAYSDTLLKIRDYLMEGGAPTVNILAPLRARKVGDQLVAQGRIITPGVNAQGANFRIPFTGFTQTPKPILLGWASGKNQWLEGPIQFDETKDGVSFYVRDTGDRTLAPGAVNVYAVQE